MTFEQLYTTYHHPIYLHLLHYTNSREQAEDLAQDTFVRALCGYTHVDERNLKGWLYTIATNLYRDAYRRHKCRAITSLEAGGIDCAVATDEDARLDAREIIARTPRVLLLVGYGYGYEHIARRLGCSQSAVKMIVMRARRKLQKEVAS